MNATEALRRTRAAEKREEERKSKAYKTKLDADEVIREKALKGYRKVYDDAKGDIADAAMLRSREATISFNTDVGSYAVARKLVEDLIKEGYNASLDSGEYDTDYGDFNAPCVVHVKWMHVKVKW